MAGAQVLARLASRPGALRRLADDPRVAFRAVSGLDLALFNFTVAATQDTKQPYTPVANAAANNTLVDQFSANSDLRSISECRFPLS